MDAPRESARRVFSHPSKLALIEDARSHGYLVTLHVVLVPVELSALRVGPRFRHGGHSGPERKVRERFERLWKLVATAVARADLAIVCDDTSARPPFREVARFETGRVLYPPEWPAWSPLGA
ncbi:MAG: zeta toxin family protein [Deltaproteobacteria bacterium]|nr:zeta toxin family protein [Deltaproteobacteria bacterium]